MMHIKALFYRYDIKTDGEDLAWIKQFWARYMKALNELHDLELEGEEVASGFKEPQNYKGDIGL